MGCIRYSEDIIDEIPLERVLGVTHREAVQSRRGKQRKIGMRLLSADAV